MAPSTSSRASRASVAVSATAGESTARGAATVGPVSILSWIFVGLIAGLLARWIVRDDRSGCLYTIAVGVLGALDRRRR